MFENKTDWNSQQKRNAITMFSIMTHTLIHDISGYQYSIWAIKYLQNSVFLKRKQLRTNVRVQFYYKLKRRTFLKD
jgi:anionic cell wall polymer biosynthesis LytR-Cps2A-Psr (LCP) family protein